MAAYLDGAEHDVGFAGNADDDRTLLDGFGGIFDLEDASLGRERHRVVVVVVTEHGGGAGAVEQPSLVIEGVDRASALSCAFVAWRVSGWGEKKAALRLGKVDGG